MEDQGRPSFNYGDLVSYRGRLWYIAGHGVDVYFLVGKGILAGAIVENVAPELLRLVLVSTKRAREHLSSRGYSGDKGQA